MEQRGGIFSNIVAKHRLSFLEASDSATQKNLGNFDNRKRVVRRARDLCQRFGGGSDARVLWLAVGKRERQFEFRDRCTKTVR